jgi:hypothetical protein
MIRISINVARPLSVALLVVAATCSVARASCSVSLDQYLSLRINDPYAVVVEILGCEGQEVSSSRSGGGPIVVVRWEGQRILGTEMTATFQRGRLVSKSHTGLR